MLITKIPELLKKDKLEVFIVHTIITTPQISNIQIFIAKNKQIKEVLAL